jgi:Uma2 family endonuclease
MQCQHNSNNVSKCDKGEYIAMVTSIVSNRAKILSLEDWMANPPEHTEWVDGKLVEKYPYFEGDEKLIEKSGMTLKHSRIQSRLARHWGNYLESSRQGGEVYTDVLCRTNKQGRFPDIAYLIPELLAQFGNSNVLPQSFPLIAEIISPTDVAEEVFGKANEYLQSGCQEVWLVLPESQWIVVITQQQRLLFTTGEVISTQSILQGFSMAVDQLLA